MSPVWQLLQNAGSALAWGFAAPTSSLPCTTPLWQSAHVRLAVFRWKSCGKVTP